MKKIYLFLVCFFLTSTSYSLDYYISPNGSDDNPGTFEEPFATLEKARDAIRAEKPFSSETDVNVWLREGTYNLSKSFELLEQDSGVDSFPVVYRNYPDEKVIISGGMDLNPSLFSQVTDKKILKRLEENARPHILEINLKKLGVTNFGKHQQYGHALPVVTAPMELYFNNEVMTLARYPNDGYMLIGKVHDTGSIPRIKDYENIRGGIFEYTDDRHEKWQGLDDVWFQGTFKWGYADDKIKVDWIDPDKHLVKLATPHMYGIDTGKNYRHYYALNILEELDSPGEWYVDKNTGMLYFWPPEDISNSKISISIVDEPMFVLDHVSFVNIQGLIFENARDMGIYIEGGGYNTIAGCTIRNMGTIGILMGKGAKQTFPHITHDDYDGVPVSRTIGTLIPQLYKYTTWDRDGGNNHWIISCDVYNTGCGGIYLSGGDKKNLINGNCLVENCRVHDYNRRNKFLWAGIIVDGCGNKIRHNEIFNSDFQGIYVHGNEHVFEYNHLHHLTLNSNDTSPWYNGRDPSDRGLVIRNNFFHHCGNPDREWTMGIYFDDAAGGGLVEGNILYKVGSFGTIYSNAGHDITVRNNILIEGYGPALTLKSMWYDFGQYQIDYYFGENSVYRTRLMESLDITKPPYSTTYPELVNWLDLMDDGVTYVGMRPKNNLFENNVIYKYGETFRLVGEHAQFDFKNNYITNQDPGFVNYETMDFQLRDNSIVYKKIPEFQKIPFEEMGLYRDEFRTTLPEDDIHYASEFFISPEGNDNNPGTFSEPFKSLEKARDAIRTIPAQHRDSLTVWLRGGYYPLKQSFELLEKDSGTKDSPIIYSAWPGEKVYISGGQKIPTNAFEKVSDNNVLKQIISTEAQNNLYQVNLKSFGISNFGEHKKFGHGLPVVTAPLEVFINNEKMPLARYPNNSAILIGKIIDTGSIPRWGDYENIRGGIFEYTDKRHEKWVGIDDIWFQGTFKWGYADDKIKVEWINPEAGQVKLTTPHMYGLGSGAPYQQYVALNILAEIDSPGEWYVDKNTGMLYIWPPENFENAEIEVSELETPMLVLDNASYVNFENVFFQVTRGMGIYIEGGQNNLIAGCTIRNCGTIGIMMGKGAMQTFPHITGVDYTGVPVSREIGSLTSYSYMNTTWDRHPGKNHGILSCDVYNTGSGGILLDGGSKKELVPGNCFVENCRVYDFQLRNRSQWPGIKVYGCGNRVSHCEVFNAALQAIMVAGNEHLFEYNHIHHVTLNSNDASAWYIGRNPSDRGNVIRYNFFHHVGRVDRKWTMCVYFDDAACDGLVEGNVFYKAGSFGTVYSNGGQDITVRNNIFIEGYGPVLQQKSMWWDFALDSKEYYFGDDGIYRNRLTKHIDIKKEPYRSAYPNLVNWLDLIPGSDIYYGMLPARNTFENNVSVKYDETYRLVGLNTQFKFKNNYVTKEDPGFIDAENMDFKLKDDSVVYEKVPDFQKIPFDEIGLYIDNYRTQLPVTGE